MRPQERLQTAFAYHRSHRASIAVPPAVRCRACCLLLLVSRPLQPRIHFVGHMGQSAFVGHCGRRFMPFCGPLRLKIHAILWAVAAEDACHFVGSVGRITLCEIRPLERLNSPGERPIRPQSEETLRGEWTILPRGGMKEQTCERTLNL